MNLNDITTTAVRRHFFDISTWPEEMRRLHNATSQLGYTDRFKLALFLWGNGLRRKILLAVMRQ